VVRRVVFVHLRLWLRLVGCLLWKEVNVLWRVHAKELSGTSRVEDSSDIADVTDHSLERVKSLLVFLLEVFRSAWQTQVVIACQYQYVLWRFSTVRTAHRRDSGLLIGLLVVGFGFGG